MASTTKGLLERLAEGVVVGDGGFCFALEKRGYVKAGVWTPECTVLHPEAVRQLHREFLRAGADVMQAFTFYTQDSKVACSEQRIGKTLPSGREMNIAAFKLAQEVASAGHALVSISLTETTAYNNGTGKEQVQPEFTKQLQFFKEEGCQMDFIICEFFSSIEEMEWAIEAAKQFGVPVACSMNIKHTSDTKGVATGECAVRMAKAGADVVGINCSFGPDIALRSMRVMKTALDKAGLNPYLMCQPLGFHTPDLEHADALSGYLNTPEHFLAYEPRVCTRFEVQKYAREAYDIGIRYIGGCCAFEPYHIRAISEELLPETNKLAPVTDEYGDIMDGLRNHPRALLEARSDIEIWKSMEPSTGRPKSSAFAQTLYNETF